MILDSGGSSGGAAMIGTMGNTTENNQNAGNYQTIAIQNAFADQDSYGGSGGMDVQGGGMAGGTDGPPLDQQSALGNTGLGTSSSCMSSYESSIHEGEGTPPGGGGNDCGGDDDCDCDATGDFTEM